MLTVGATRPGLYVPPAWTNVMIDPDPEAALVATGYDAKGRKQYLYSAEHAARAKADKFERVRLLLAESAAIEKQIQETLNDSRTPTKTREAALVAYLIYRTGIRPGSTADTLADKQAYGATTLQLRHVTLNAKSVTLRFVGKKGVQQAVRVTDPYLVEELRNRKTASAKWSSPVFTCTAGQLNKYIATLGSGEYTAKDFRTRLGTSLALKILGARKRLPKAVSKRKKIINTALDKVAKQLGNTRAVSRSAYVDPIIIEAFYGK